MSSIRCVENHRESVRHIIETNGTALEPHNSSTLEPDAIGGAARSAGVRIFDIVVTLGDFDAILLLGAPDNAAVAKLLDGLEGWRTVALLAISHSRYELPDPLRPKSRTAV